MGDDYWENRFQQQFSKVDDKQKAGVLLSLIPSHDEWPEFQSFVRQQWHYSEGYYSIRRERPHCFVALLGGVAFYEYEEHRFWPHFAKQVGGQSIPASKQHEINADFVRVAAQLGLKMLGTDYVGSAVYQIGIPLSLWHHFLRFCEWAWANEGWETFSTIDWEKAVEKRITNIPRLRNFLLGNRGDAITFTHEILDARRILSAEEKLTLSELKQASLLRQEYFDEVPETAEFLRPSNPDSLFQNRAKLYWDEGRINLHLPAVANDKLPAIWKIGHVVQGASTTPDSLSIDSAAFEETLVLTLQSGDRLEKQRLSGLRPFGLWDAEREKFVNYRREALPVGHYYLISRDTLKISRRGFDEDENPENELYELRDGSNCYVTRLAPNGKSAEVRLSQTKEKISFRSGLKIEARIFAGQGSFAANFDRYEQWIKVERLPLLYLAVPFGSFENPELAVQQKFAVFVGEEKVEGHWEKQHEDNVQEFYTWNWKDDPQIKKKVSIAIQAKDHSIRFEYQIEMLQSRVPEHCWQNLPGAFLPMVLLAQPLSQMKDGLKWQDLLAAREAIAPNGPQVSSYYLREYVNRGFLAYDSKHRWSIAESRYKLEPVDEGDCLMSYCGNPSILWGLFKYINNNHSDTVLPEVEVVNLKGELPYLQILWQARHIDSVKKYFGNHKEVRLVSDLWRP